MHAGFIKLHRKLLDWEWYSDTNVMRVFTHLLLKANYEESRWQGQTFKAGQLPIGRKELSKILGLSEQNIRTALKKLETTQEITIKSTSRYSIITLNKWVDYQQTNQLLTNNQPTTNQRLTTLKEKKNKINKEKNIGLGEFENIFLSENETQKIKEIYKEKFNEAIETLSSYIQSSGKKYKSHYAVLGKHNWIYEKLANKISEEYNAYR